MPVHMRVNISTTILYRMLLDVILVSPVK